MCVWGTYVSFGLSLRESKKKKHQLLLHGLAYIFGVFITYLTAGLILMPILGSLGQFSVAMYLVLGTLVIIFGLLEIKDFFWYGKGPSLALLPGAQERIKLYAKYISDNVLSAVFLGMFVALVELPCTGAVYLAILSMMALSGFTPTIIFWLIIYNLVFILPLVVILIAFNAGMTHDRMEAWRKKHRKVMRLSIGLVLLLLGGWMITSVL